MKNIIIFLIVLVSVPFNSSPVFAQGNSNNSAFDQDDFLNSINEDEFDEGGIAGTGTLEEECVILLHGLGQKADSMKYIVNHLKVTGFKVQNMVYDSESKPIEKHAEIVEDGIALCQYNGATTIHLVGHSLGAIIMRHYIATGTVSNIDKIVLLAPPNKGSRIVNIFGSNKERAMEKYGIPFVQLGQGKQYFVNQIPVTGTENMGIIAGTGKSTLKDYFFSILIKGLDDGIVSVASTRLPGVGHNIIVPFSHHDIIYSNKVHEQIAFFLQNGQFKIDK